MANTDVVMRSANLEYIRQKMISIYNDSNINSHSYLLSTYEDTIDIYLADIQLLKQQIEQFRNRPITTIKQLHVKLIDINLRDQAGILGNLLTSNKKEEIYLIDYIKNTSTDKKKANTVGSFTILGSMTKKGRAQYEIRLYKQESNEPRSFWCSCPDHKFNSAKKGTCCKHICMIVCKVAKVLDPLFFETKKLTDAQYTNLLSKLESRETLLTENCRPSGMVFNKITKALTEDDICPICYDEFNTPALDQCSSEVALTQIPGVLSCPSCKNCMHQVCMEVWLENKDTCVFCRSDIWKNYKR